MRDFSKILGQFESRQEILWTGALALLCFFVLFHNLGAAALFEPDEGRNAEVAREILLLKDWVTPHYDFIPYLDKPMFFYWPVALAYKLFGVSEWSARLPSALAALGCVLLVYNLAQRPLGAWGGLWSSLVLLTSPAFFAFSRTVIFDMPLTFFITLALWAFYRGKSADGKPKRLFFLVMYGAMGCATLVKGPIGFVLPAMAISLYLLLTQRWSILREMDVAVGLWLFILVAAPWYLWVELRNPGYIRYFLLEENLLRYLTPHFNRGQPWYYYVEVLAVGFFPWSALIYAPFKQIATALRDERRLFLLLWAVLPLLFFSLSVAKQPGYILPIFPPLSVLMGEAITRMLRASSTKARRPLAIPWLILLAALSCFTLALSLPDLLTGHLKQQPLEVLALIRQISGPFIPLLLMLAALSAGASIWAEPRLYYLISCVFFSIFHLFGVAAMELISQMRSSQHLAEKAALLIRPGDQMVIYDSYLSSLPFYLRVDRPIWVVSPGRRSTIMGSLYMAERKPQPSAGFGKTVLSFEEFSEVWNQSPARLLVFADEKRLAPLYQEASVSPKRLLTVGRVALVTNQ